jgi:hypothetical protein
MNGTTIRTDVPTRDKLNDLAYRCRRPAGHVLRHLVDAYGERAVADLVADLVPAAKREK